MHHSLAPRLRTDVAVRPFDAAEGDCRFVVAVDDRHFVVSAAVAAVLEESREPGTFASLAQRASARLGVHVSPEQVGQLLREQAPAILFHAAESHAVRGPVWFRHRILSGDRLEPILRWTARLFSARIAIALIAALVLVEALVASRAAGMPVAHPAAREVAAAFALTVAGVVVHEIGHLAACHRYGGRHGGMGVGLYWCFPTLYAEVHGAWLLPRLQRAVVDIGGVYFQSGYVLALGAIYLATGTDAVLGALAWSHFLMLHTLNPVLKFDGYWLLADLTGAHNLHRWIRTIAQRAWQGATLMQSHPLPAPRELALLAAFVAIAFVYFAYLLAMLGQSIAAAAVGALHSLSAMQTLASSALLAAWLVMAIGLALLLARALTVFARETSDDR
jgi:putative peptide zinc metalloprotease protein